MSSDEREQIELDAILALHKLSESPLRRISISSLVVVEDTAVLAPPTSALDATVRKTKPAPPPTKRSSSNNNTGIVSNALQAVQNVSTLVDTSMRRKRLAAAATAPESGAASAAAAATASTSAKRKHNVAASAAVSAASEAVGASRSSVASVAARLIELGGALPVIESVRTLQLVDAVSTLGVAKRRVYDVFGILEPLRVLTRVKKDTYEWHGTAPMMQLLSELRTGVREHGDPLATTRAKKKTSALSTLTMRIVKLIVKAEKDDTLLTFATLQSLLETRAEEVSVGAKDDDDDADDANSDEDSEATTLLPTQQRKAAVSRRLYDVISVLSAVEFLKHEKVVLEAGDGKANTTKTKKVKVIRLAAAPGEGEADDEE
jgi:hypothetical protein